MKHTEMEIQILTILSNIWLAINGFLSTCWGKIVLAALFIGSTFAPISGLIHITLILVFIDMFFGVAVTVKTKGWKHLLSSRLRDSLIKLFFYLLFIMLFFLIEKELFDQWYIGAKAVFAITSGVEIWSILANMMILSPNLPFLKLLKKVLSAEMARKLGIEINELNETMDNTDSTNNPTDC